MTELVRTYKLTDSGAWGWVTEEAEGGGGGSLPSWWTVDSTPGAESVEFAGSVVVDGAGEAGWSGFGVSPDYDGDGLGLYVDQNVVRVFGMPFEARDSNNTQTFVVGPTGAVTISPSDPGTIPLLLKPVSEEGSAKGALVIETEAVPADYEYLLRVTTDADDYPQDMLVFDSAGQLTLRPFQPDAWGLTIQAQNLVGGKALVVIDINTDEMFAVGPSGAVTISPSGGAAPLTLVGLPTADPTVAGQLWNDTGTVKVSAG